MQISNERSGWYEVTCKLCGKKERTPAYPSPSGHYCQDCTQIWLASAMIESIVMKRWDLPSMIVTHLGGRLVRTPLLTGSPILIDEAVLCLKKLDELVDSCGNWRWAAIKALQEAMPASLAYRSWDNIEEWFFIPEVHKTFQMTRLEVREAPAHIVHHTFQERRQSEFVEKAEDSPYVGLLRFTTYDFPWTSWEELMEWAWQVVYLRMAQISLTCHLDGTVHLSPEMLRMVMVDRSLISP